MNKLNFMLVVMISLSSLHARSDPLLLKEMRREDFSRYSMIQSEATGPLLIRTSLDNDKISVGIASFYSDVEKYKDWLKVGLNNVYLLARAHFLNGSSELAVAYADLEGRWYLAFCSLECKEVVKTVSIDNVSMVTAVAFAGESFFVSGVSDSGNPYVAKLDNDLKAFGDNLLSDESDGEVTSVVPAKVNEVVAVVNYRNSNSKVIIIGADGSIKYKKSIFGKAANIAITDDGEIFVVYQFDGYLHAALLGGGGGQLWKHRLVEIRGHSTALMQAVVLSGGGFAIIGANNGSMFAMKVDREIGVKSISNASDGFLPPMDGIYYVSGANDGVHIRGIARSKETLKDGGSVELHYLVK